MCTDAAIVRFAWCVCEQVANLQELHSTQTQQSNSTKNAATPQRCHDQQGLTEMSLNGSQRFSVHQPQSAGASADIEVYGRKHSYLFWEFENKPVSDEVSKLVGLGSLIDHPESSFLVDTEHFDEWSHDVLGGLLGLSVRECDDFATFWAGSVQKQAGSIMVARIVPEETLAKVASLNVTTSTPVPVHIRRVYVTMLVCKQLPPELERNKDKMLRTTSELPAELRDCGGVFPITHNPDALTVIEWGGMFLCQ